MPELIRGPLREVRSRAFDSARWRGYRPRADDIVIATYPKCGTTWMQRIVSMLVFQSAEPRPVQDISPWPDMRLFGPVERVHEAAEAQTHRRFFKAHLPYEALPVHAGVKFIHVARDGRDAALSYHNHQTALPPATIEQFTKISLADPKFGTPYPAIPADPADYFHQWVTAEEEMVGDPSATFFHIENDFWSARDEANVLLVHFNDLKRDRDGEMRRIADFLEIETPRSLWGELVAAASFEAMKAQGERLLPGLHQRWPGGSGRFLQKGATGRWQGVVRPEDLALYEAKVASRFAPELANWVERGRLG